MVRRPARLRSAALRGPTPFRNWSGVDSRSSDTIRPGAAGTRLLDDDGLAEADFDALDIRGQRERIVEAEAIRVVRGLRVAAQELLQEHLGHRHARHLRRLD